MASTYDIEMSEPSASTCECCGGLTVRLTRFVHRDGDAFAIYYATYSNNHPDGELAMLISLGEWGEDSDPSERAAFYCRVRPTADSYEVMLDDVARSPWSEVSIIGARLSQTEARRHPWKATAFEVLDEAFLQDPSLKGFLRRAHCGHPAMPLERSFQAPDELFALRGDTDGRVEISRSFASLDRTRFFIRCLLPVPVEGYGSWCVGLWVEISKPDRDRIAAAWNEPEAYSALRFHGVIANDIAADLDLPVELGSRVELHVPDPDASPMIAPPTTGELSELLGKAWPKGDFEAYALWRGFL